MKSPWTRRWGWSTCAQGGIVLRRAHYKRVSRRRLRRPLYIEFEKERTIDTYQSEYLRRLQETALLLQEGTLADAIGTCIAELRTPLTAIFSYGQLLAMLEHIYVELQGSFRCSVLRSFLLKQMSIWWRSNDRRSDSFPLSISY